MADRDSIEGTREDLYDAYVEAALAGRAPPPREYLADHDRDDPELLQRLEAVHGAARRASASDRADGDLPFERLGPYRVLRRLDEGGMGMVYLGAEERLGRLVALKVLRPELQGSATQAARFEREAQVVARLRHPNIVTIYGVGEERGMRFLAMEYVEGEGLDDVIARTGEERRPVPVATAVRWAIQVAGALEAAHDVGVIHRDVKPSNVRIGPDGNAVLLDFGIAAEEGTSRLTRAGAFLGTVAYAAPEQLRARDDTEADGRADTYSLGVVLYETLTGVQPFDGRTEIDSAERALVADPIPARRLRRDVPRDLETVLQVAMERDPARRYTSAAAFAEDLRAVLEVRPIRARRPGPLRRMLKLARRHPVATAAIVVAVLALVGTFVAEDLRTKRAAREALADAREGVTRFRGLCEQARTAEQEFLHYDGLIESKYMTEEADAALAQSDHAVHVSRRDREAGFHVVLSALRRAERLDPDLPGIDDVRAALYVERWREARTRRDDDAAAFYRQAALDLSPSGDLAEQLDGTGRIIVRCDTPGAAARVFRWELLSEIVADGEERLVPVPVGGVPQLRAGAWAFRALGPLGPVETGDLVTRVSGREPDEASWAELARELASGAEIQLLGRNGMQTATIGPGLESRITTQPLEWITGEEALGTDGIVCPAGPALVVVRAARHEELRRVVFVQPGETVAITCRPLPAGATPSGFVRIPPSREPSSVAIVIQEREVTATEYLEFLNDPATLAEIDASPTPIRYPRNGATIAEGGHWTRGDDGRYAIPDEWPADWPALGLSFDDALAYCAWWSRRAAARGEPWRARLPTLGEWVSAAAPGTDRLFVYGNRFHPKWASSCFSRPEARVEQVMTYPRDETVHGAFDMSGSLREWVDAWWDEEKGLRRVAGGSWARAPREFFRVWGGQGFAPESVSDENGFRLVLDRDETGDE